MLWVTTDGRKAALWMGLHGIKEEYPAKLDAVATQMALVYRRWQEDASYLPGTYKSLQIGFCDMGTPNEEKGDQVYGELNGYSYRNVFQHKVFVSSMKPRLTVLRSAF